MNSTRFTHTWRIRKLLNERFGQPLRVVARGGRNSVLVEFADGFLCVTSRNFIRRRKGGRS